MRRYLTTLAVAFLFTAASTAETPTLWTGGAVSLFLPSNTFNKSAVGFNDVANTGFGIKGTFDWNFQPTLSLGAEIGFLRSSIDQQFWQVDNRGTVEGSYIIIPLMINTKILLQTGDIKPYFGIAFGASYLSNYLNFVSYNEAIKPSFSYTNNNFRPTAAPEVGIQFKLAKSTILNLALRYCFISNLEPTYVVSYDENGYAIENQSYTENAHGKENYFELGIGLLFGNN